MPSSNTTCSACTGTAILERRAAGLYGPDEDGWCMPCGEDHGATCYVNVDYCPWCGRLLNVRGEAKP